MNYLKLSAKLGNHVNKTVHFENLLIFILVLKVVGLVMFDLGIYIWLALIAQFEKHMCDKLENHMANNAGSD